jgi:dTDP-4-dehydrorhamnose reductase
MRSLIIGAQGLVGSALARQLPDAIQGIQFEAKNKNQRYMDITKYETMFKVFADFRPQIVYLCAAIAHVDKCEEITTGIVNVRGVTTVLRLCEQFESKLVFYSSSYVFDGKSKSPYKENDDISPIQNYGLQKAQMEKLILQSDLKHVIIRTVGVFGRERRKKNFAKQVIKAVFNNQEVFAPNDQWMNPILSDDLARVSIRLANKNAGIFHVAGDECLTKFEFAQRIAGYFDYKNKVVAKTSEEMNQKAKRPKMGCLNCTEIENLGIVIPSLSTGMQKFLGSDGFSG